jgi:serine/threonine-protein kinase
MSSPPTTLGKYQIIREIARSNDIVYEAYDPLMNRRVAVKELAMPNGSTPQQREERISRFKREARAAGTLAHPNIMTVYELGEQGDRFFIAMEYLDGNSLRNELDAKGTIPLDRAMEIELSVLKGLEFAHSKGVIHRDIKPDNIQLLSDGRVKLTDFGIARLTFEPNLTMDGQVFGTPSYMSPEQVVGRDIDARSDLFSAGIVLYEMLSGRKPFVGDSVVSITYAIMNKEPEQLPEANYALWQVIARSLDKSPALRYSSAADMIAALESAQAAASHGPVLDPNPGYGAQAYGAQYGSGTYGANPYGPPQIGGPQLGHGMSGGMSPGMASAPTPPPVMYTYNPYAPSQPAVGTHTPTGYTQGHSGLTQNFAPSALNSPYVPNPSGLPIYYPPPPRQPLISAETRQFWGKLFLAFIVIGTIIGVLILLANSLSTSLGRAEMRNHDRETVAELNNELPALDPQTQLKRIEEKKGDLQSDFGREEGRALEAEAQRKIGEQCYQNHDYAGAEVALKNAIDLNPDNGEAHQDLATVYQAIAQDVAYAQQSSLFWSKSVQSWVNAASIERDPGQRNRLTDSAVKASVQYADKVIQMGDQASAEDMASAQESLERVQGIAVPNSQAAVQISRLMAKLRSANHGS